MSHTIRFTKLKRTRSYKKWLIAALQLVAIYNQFHFTQMLILCFPKDNRKCLNIKLTCDSQNEILDFFGKFRLINVPEISGTRGSETSKHSLFWRAYGTSIGFNEHRSRDFLRICSKHLITMFDKSRPGFFLDPTSLIKVSHFKNLLEKRTNGSTTCGLSRNKLV